ncbi:MAG: very short patch repair endonuclease [Clostridia bacterium]|nr:very short patch repair endonuclease [Clostridia bacterium]
MDVHDPQTRSYNMSMIKGKQTKPEELVAKYLFSRGVRYRRNVKTLPGKPDIVLKKYKTVVFVNGCFWHLHEGCRYFVWPENNKEFWKDKLLKNKERDIAVRETLEKSGWKVLVVWECDLKHDSRENTLAHVYDDIVSTG